MTEIGIMIETGLEPTTETMIALERRLTTETTRSMRSGVENMIASMREGVMTIGEIGTMTEITTVEIETETTMIEGRETTIPGVTEIPDMIREGTGGGITSLSRLR